MSAPAAGCRVGLELLAWCASALDRPVLNIEASTECIAWLQQKKIDSLYYLSTRADSPVQRLYDKVFSIQQAELRRICVRISELGLHPILFKGGELSQRFYCGRALALSNDSDILVARNGLPAVKSLLFQEGYRQAFFEPKRFALVDQSIQEVADIELTHYQLAPFNRVFELQLDSEELEFASTLKQHPTWVDGARAIVVVEFDIHHNLASDVDSEPLFKNAGLNKGFSPCYSLSDTDHLWLLISRYYNEVALHGKSSLRDFAYILPFLQSGTIDWEYMLSVAEQYSIHSALFYYLSFCDRLCGAVPESVLHCLSPARQAHRMRDWGWQLATLFSVIDPFPLF